MAQTPPAKAAIPPSPSSPQAAGPSRGTNIHGQPNPPPPSQQPPDPHQAQVNVEGRPPQPNLFPEDEPPEGLGDNTLAEMEAGRKNLAQYGNRNNAEHEAGRRAVQQRSGR
jgi:hypothetical protein